MANKAQILGLLALMGIAGAFMAFNLTEVLWGLEMGLGFNDITNGINGFFTIIARAVGVGLMVISTWAGFKTMTEL